RLDAAAAEQALVEEQAEPVLVRLAERQVGEIAAAAVATEVEVDVLELAVQCAGVAAGGAELRQHLAACLAHLRLGAVDLVARDANVLAGLLGQGQRLGERQLARDRK